MYLQTNTNMWIIEQTSINNEINKKNKKKQTVTWSFWIKIYNPVKKNKWVTILDPLKKKKSQLCVYDRTANISCRLDHK